MRKSVNGFCALDRFSAERKIITMNGLVSVIVPVYNTEGYLERCFDSILNQEYDNWEMIVVDDGSNDESVKVIEKYIEKHDIRNKMRVICTEHGGAGHARNIGIENARGEYICFVDSDDFVTPTYIAGMINQALEADIVICGRKTIDGDYVKEDIPSIERSCNREEAILDIINKKENSFLAVCKLYRASVLKDNKILFVEGIRFEDMIFSFSANAVSNKIAYCKDMSYVYCVREGSQSETIDSTMFKDYLKAISLVLKALVDVDILLPLRQKLHFYTLEALYRANLWFSKDKEKKTVEAFIACSGGFVKLIRAIKLSKTPNEEVKAIVQQILDEES